MMKDNRIHIPFHIHPYLFEQQQHAVEKADNQGRKRRYLYGVSSGMKTDGTGERMTQRCVKGMQEQANSGEILLYSGQHGVDHTDDIGRLVESQITPGGDWVTTYRLYDEYDGFDPGSKTLEKANKLWKQVCGIKPYENPMQKGFSIEGYIPDNGILEMSNDGKRVIDWVDLEGVLVTPRPAYEDSILKAVYKALDILPPEKANTEMNEIKITFSKLLQDGERERNFYTQQYKLEEVRDEMISKIMARGVQIRDRLEIVFIEYKKAMIQLILEYRDVFNQQIDQSPLNGGSVDVAKSQRLRVYKNIHDQIKTLQAMVVRRGKKSKKGNKDRERKCTNGFSARGKDNP